MKTFSKLILVILTAFLCNSCKKDNSSLATGSRVSSIAANINGNAFHNDVCSACIGGGSGIVVDYENNILTVFGQQGKLYMAVQVAQLSTPGTYKFVNNSFTTTYGVYSNSDDPAPNGDINNYYTSASLPGSITITKIDTQNKIVQGSFTFDAESNFISGKIVHITDGNFIAYYY